MNHPNVFIPQNRMPFTWRREKKVGERKVVRRWRTASKVTLQFFHILLFKWYCNVTYRVFYFIRELIKSAERKVTIDSLTIQLFSFFSQLSHCLSKKKILFRSHDLCFSFFHSFVLFFLGDLLFRFFPTSVTSMRNPGQLTAWVIPTN